MQPESLVIAYGKISERDEKEPQILLDTLRPISDADDLTAPQKKRPLSNGKTLFIKLSSEESPDYEKLKLLHTMFPGNEQMVIHFTDTKKNLGAKCVIHEAFLNELHNMFGEKNVVVR